MQNIDLNELQANFQDYVERAAKGEEFAVTRNGSPVAKLVAYSPSLPRIGFMKGQFTFDAAASDSMDKEIEELFYAGEIFPPEDGPTTVVEPGRSGNLDKSGE